MENELILSGSRAFFDGLENFDPHDTDYVILSNIINPKKVQFTFYKKDTNTSIFTWSKHFKKKDLLEFLINYEPAYTFALILIPKVAENYQIIIDDLKQLLVIKDKLDNKHIYLGMILQFYIDNNDFILTNEQRLQAFKSYINTRK